MIKPAALHSLAIAIIGARQEATLTTRLQIVRLLYHFMQGHPHLTALAPELRRYAMIAKRAKDAELATTLIKACGLIKLACLEKYSLIV